MSIKSNNMITNSTIKRTNQSNRSIKSTNKITKSTNKDPSVTPTMSTPRFTKEKLRLTHRASKHLRLTHEHKNTAILPRVTLIEPFLTTRVSRKTFYQR